LLAPTRPRTAFLAAADLALLRFVVDLALFLVLVVFDFDFRAVCVALQLSYRGTRPECGVKGARDREHRRSHGGRITPLVQGT